MSVGCLRDKCVNDTCFLESIELVQTASKEPMKGVRGPGCGQGCWVDRGAMPALGGSANALVLVNLESVVCVQH